MQSMIKLIKNAKSKFWIDYKKRKLLDIRLDFTTNKWFFEFLQEKKTMFNLERRDKWFYL